MTAATLAARKTLFLGVAGVVGAALGTFVSMITNFALVEISISPLFSVYFGGLFVLIGCLVLWRVISHEAHEPLPLPKLHLSIFAGLIVVSGVLCFLVDRRLFAGLRPWMKVPLYTVLGSSVCFAMTFAIVDVVNYMVGLCQSSVAKPVVESINQVLLLLLTSLAMGTAFGFTFGVLDVASEDELHMQVARLRDEQYGRRVGLVLGGLLGVGIEHCRQRDNYMLAAAGKTQFDEDI